METRSAPPGRRRGRSGWRGWLPPRNGHPLGIVILHARNFPSVIDEHPLPEIPPVRAREGSLALDSYKEYIELFAHSLKQTMGSRDGITYLLQACGFEVTKEDINLQPETRWKVQR